jgi:hypothetical protein
MSNELPLDQDGMDKRSMTLDNQSWLCKHKDDAGRSNYVKEGWVLDVQKNSSMAKMHEKILHED